MKNQIEPNYFIFIISSVTSRIIFLKEHKILEIKFPHFQVIYSIELFNFFYF